jgi:hypothetical protein
MDMEFVIVFFILIYHMFNITFNVSRADTVTELLIVPT